METIASESEESEYVLNDDNPEYMLVSDSDEIGGQYDSKRMDYPELVELAQDSLFKKYLPIMSRYLTTVQYENFIELIQRRYNTCKSQWDSLNAQTWTNHFTPVDGQVILIKADKVPLGKSPSVYLREHWNITSEYTVTQLQDCMLRGVVNVQDGNIKFASNMNVGLTDDNMPPHMHHPGITKDADIETMQGSSNSENKVRARNSDDKSYDMFYNDSFSTGVTNNEMDGVVDTFTVNESGDDTVQHNNMPLYDRFYAFEVRRNG